MNAMFLKGIKKKENKKMNFKQYLLVRLTKASCYKT
jgi:hypothetical protein